MTHSGSEPRPCPDESDRFVTALPFKTLSRHPVVTDLYDDEEGWKPAHIELADAADLLLIAPATANTLAKLAHGLADDALGCIALALTVRAHLGQERKTGGLPPLRPR